MKDIRQISVKDETATGFRYAVGSCIAIDFDRCWSVEQDAYLASPCSLIIKQWVKASAVDDTGKEHPLERKLGVIDMVLWLKLEGNVLQMWVETIDGRYLLLKFEDAVAGYIFSEAKQ